MFDRLSRPFGCGFQSGIITFTLNYFPSEIAILVLTANKHKNGLKSLEIVISILLVKCDGKERAIKSSVVIGSGSLLPRVDFRGGLLTIGSHSRRHQLNGKEDKNQEIKEEQRMC